MSLDDMIVYLFSCLFFRLGMIEVHYSNQETTNPNKTHRKRYDNAPPKKDFYMIERSGIFYA